MGGKPSLARLRDRVPTLDLYAARQCVDVRRELAEFAHAVFTHRNDLLAEIRTGVVNYVRKKSIDFPEFLALYIQCKEFHALPVAGGVLDQPWFIWTAMTEAGSTYEVEMRKKAEDEAIDAKASEGFAKFLSEHQGISS